MPRKAKYEHGGEAEKEMSMSRASRVKRAKEKSAELRKTMNLCDALGLSYGEYMTCLKTGLVHTRTGRTFESRGGVITERKRIRS